MSHSISIKLVKLQDAINYNFSYHPLKGGIAAINRDSEDLEEYLGLNWLHVETDYFGGIGEQGSESKDKTFNSINEGLREVFGIQRTKELDEFDVIGLGSVRGNDDFIFMEHKDRVTLPFDINDDNILNAYKFGSHVYGTNNPESDEDYILVLREFKESDNINVHHYTHENFQKSLDNCDIQMLECICANKKHVLKDTISFNFRLDKYKLRVAISTITSNSWVKGGKKLTISGDYDLKLAIKSVFHSLRILDFGIQILTSGKILNFSSTNWILEDLWKLSAQYQREELWQKIIEKYKKLFNSKSSEFKALAPKPTEYLNNNIRIKELTEVLKTHSINIYENLINDIVSVFEK